MRIRLRNMTPSGKVVIPPHFRGPSSPPHSKPLLPFGRAWVPVEKGKKFFQTAGFLVTRKTRMFPPPDPLFFSFIRRFPDPGKRNFRAPTPGRTRNFPFIRPFLLLENSLVFSFGLHEPPM